MNEVIPDIDKISTMDLESVYAHAKKHMIGAVVAMALESAGYKDELSRKVIGKALRRSTLFDKNWREISARLEKAGIWYTPLKGAVLKTYYPKYGMREFSDHDILFDSDRTEEVKEIMEDLGFTARKYGIGFHDEYHKPPVLNFEMHRSLFSFGYSAKVFEYYKDIGKQLLTCEGRERHFTPEDFYIYLIAHEYKHFSRGGTGLRSLLDTYVYLSKETLDMDYIYAETEKIEIDAFEKQNRSLSLHLFKGESLTEDNRQMLDYILSSGTFGTIHHRVQNKMDQNSWGRVRYAIYRLIVPISKKNRGYDGFAGVYPFFYKHKLFLPFLPLYRTFRSIKSGRFQREVKAVRDAKKKRE